MADQLSYYRGNRSFDDVVREEFAFSLLFNNIAPVKMAAALQSVGLRRVPNAFLLIRIDDCAHGSGRFSIENELITKVRILDIVRAHLEKVRWDHMAADLTGTDSVIVLFCVEGADGCEEELSRISQELCERVRHFTSHTVSVCISDLCVSAAQLSRNYERARASLRESAFPGKRPRAKDDPAAERASARPTDSAFREMVQRYIREHYREKIYLEEIAASCGYSKYYFCRQFKKCFGIGLSDSVNRYRVERAKELMRGGYQSVEEVACEVGFSSANYFEIVFRKSEGISPTVFRKRSLPVVRDLPDGAERA